MVKNISKTQATVVWDKAKSGAHVTGYYIEFKEKSTLTWAKYNLQPYNRNEITLKGKLSIS